MKIPAEFEDILRGVELTEREKRFLRWITSWDDHTMQNMRTVVEKVRSTLSTLQAENEKLRADLEQVKRERDEDGLYTMKVTGVIKKENMRPHYGGSRMADILTIIAAVEWMVLGLLVLRKLKGWNRKMEELYEDMKKQWEAEE